MFIIGFMYQNCLAFYVHLQEGGLKIFSRGLLVTSMRAFPLNGATFLGYEFFYCWDVCKWPHICFIRDKNRINNYRLRIITIRVGHSFRKKILFIKYLHSIINRRKWTLSRMPTLLFVLWFYHPVPTMFQSNLTIPIKVTANSWLQRQSFLEFVSPDYLSLHQSKG